MGGCCAKGPPDVRDDYEIGDKLGAGAFGQVRKAQHNKTKEQRAVKIIWKEEQGVTLEELMEEITVTRLMDHPYIVRLYDFYEDEKFLYAVIDCYTGGELFQKLSKSQQEALTEAEIVRYVVMMVSAVQFLGKVSVVHRDIKPENFLLKSPAPDSDLCMIDFGLSQRINSTEYLSVCCGTIQYLSPEQIRGTYRFSCDMWAVGVVVYLLLYGKYPFSGSSDGKIMQQIMNKDVTQEKGFSKVSKRSQDFLRQILQKEPKQRITPEQGLAHIWLTKGPDPGAQVIERSTLQSAQHEVLASKRVADANKLLELENRRDEELKNAAQVQGTSRRRVSVLSGRRSSNKRSSLTMKRGSNASARASTDLSVMPERSSEAAGKTNSGPKGPERRQSVLQTVLQLPTKVVQSIVPMQREPETLGSAPGTEGGHSKFCNDDLQKLATGYQRALSLGAEGNTEPPEDASVEPRNVGGSQPVPEKETPELRKQGTDSSIEEVIGSEAGAGASKGRVRPSTLVEQEEMADAFDMDAFEPPVSQLAALPERTWVDVDKETKRDDEFDKMLNKPKEPQGGSFMDAVKAGSRRIIAPLMSKDADKDNGAKARLSLLGGHQPGRLPEPPPKPVNRGESTRGQIHAAQQFRGQPVSEGSHPFAVN